MGSKDSDQPSSRVPGIYMDSGGKLKQELQQSQPDPGQAATVPLRDPELVLQDYTLVQRLILREESAWHEFVTSYDRLIQQRSRATCTEVGMSPGQSEIASEICAEVYASLVARNMESLKQFSGRSRISTWLFVVVRRIALRHLARLRRLPVSNELDLSDLIPDQLGQEEEQADRLESMREARQQLSPGDQEVLRLFYDTGLSYEQLASVLKISVNAVGPKLDRARRRLRVLVKPPPDD